MSTFDIFRPVSGVRCPVSIDGSNKALDTRYDIRYTIYDARCTIYDTSKVSEFHQWSVTSASGMFRYIDLLFFSVVYRVDFCFHLSASYRTRFSFDIRLLFVCWPTSGFCWWRLLPFVFTVAADSRSCWWPLLVVTVAADGRCRWWPLLLVTVAAVTACTAVVAVAACNHCNR